MTPRSISSASRHVDRLDLHPERRCRGLDDGKLAGAGALGGIPKDRRSRHAWCGLLEQFQPFRAQTEFETNKACGVAARPRQAVDEAGADRIDDDREHDRHRAGRLQHRSHGRSARGQNDVGRERGQFRRVSANIRGIGRGPAGVDAHVVADGPTQLRQRLKERPDPGLKFRVVRGCRQQHADAPHLLALLRASDERPRDCRAAEKCNELAPLQMSP